MKSQHLPRKSSFTINYAQGSSKMRNATFLFISPSKKFEAMNSESVQSQTFVPKPRQLYVGKRLAHFVLSLLPPRHFGFSPRFFDTLAPISICYFTIMCFGTRPFAYSKWNLIRGPGEWKRMDGLRCSSGMLLDESIHVESQFLDAPAFVVSARL